MTSMGETVFVEARFWLLVAFSFVAPVAIYAGLLATRAVARTTVLLLGLALIAIAGLDLYLLRGLIGMAKATSSLADDAIFQSELTLALYLLPALFAGVGINIVSHVLIRHLEEAEARYDSEHAEDA
jgi:hypothetical protein